MSELKLERYSDKSWILRGDSRKFKDIIQNQLNGKWNRSLKGWIFSNRNKDRVEQFLKSGEILPKKPYESKEEKENEELESSQEENEEEVELSEQQLETIVKQEEWWNNLDKKTGEKWKELKHNGVYFPPPYKPVNVPIKYNGQKIMLDSTDLNNKFNITAEEAGMFFAMKLEQDKRLCAKNSKRASVQSDQKFKENFWNDWKEILGNSSPIVDFNKVDFTDMINYIERKTEEKKERSKEEKKREKEEKEKIKEIYGFALIDGQKISIGNYTVQPPGLYIGHGQQPSRGKIKKRISPKDITLNVSRQYAPKCTINGKPCEWGKIEENHNVIWIANWRNPVTNDLNHVWLSRNESPHVGENDIKKFEKARELKNQIEKVRQKYEADMVSVNSKEREVATATYLLDILAIRPGGTKDEEKEAPTLGLTTLKVENITLNNNSNITIDFSGKSSINFSKTFKVSASAYNNLLELTMGKNKNSLLFPTANATALNSYLGKMIPGLTAKVFRTYSACIALQSLLEKTNLSVDDDVTTKKLAFDRANQAAAVALNHKNLTITDDKVTKLKQKIEALNIKRSSPDIKEREKKSAERQLKNAEQKLEQAEENISLTTSKVNYIDPRCVVSWCKKNDMPIEKIYNKTQLRKFIWSMEVPSNWKF